MYVDEFQTADQKGNRKLVEEINYNKAKLKNLNTLEIDIIGLTPTSHIYIKPSLSPYNGKLAYNCRLLKRDGKIAKVITEDDGTIKIVTLNNDFIKIKHESDLVKRFKNFSFTFDDE